MQIATAPWTIRQDHCTRSAFLWNIGSVTTAIHANTATRQGLFNQHRACNRHGDGNEPGAKTPEHSTKLSVPSGQAKVYEGKDQKDKNPQLGIEVDHRFRSSLTRMPKSERRFNTAGRQCANMTRKIPRARQSFRACGSSA